MEEQNNSTETDQLSVSHDAAAPVTTEPFELEPFVPLVQPTMSNESSSVSSPTATTEITPTKSDEIIEAIEKMTSTPEIIKPVETEVAPSEPQLVKMSLMQKLSAMFKKNPS